MDSMEQDNWMAEGNCASREPSTFFPSDGVGVEVARRICSDCPVKEPCLEYAVTNRISRRSGRGRLSAVSPSGRRADGSVTAGQRGVTPRRLGRPRRRLP